jgi:hypothetical protein
MGGDRLGQQLGPVAEFAKQKEGSRLSSGSGRSRRTSSGRSGIDMMVRAIEPGATDD